MPVAVQWTSRKTGQVVPVQKIDDEMREYFGHPPNSETFCWEYQGISLLAIGSLMDGGSVVTEELLEAHMDKMKNCEYRESYREFLLCRYEVKCWRGG